MNTQQIRTSSSFRQMLWLIGFFSSTLLMVANGATGFSALVVEEKTGRIVFSHEADSVRYPASLTKMMSLYLVFEALQQGHVSFSMPVKVSAKAAKAPPSKLGVSAGEAIPLELAIKVLVVKSANDVAIAVAETIAGSEARFVERMNQTAKRLGMSRTHFVNPHGLPDTRQVTSARDMYILAVALKHDFPAYYAYFNTRSYTYNQKRVETHNRVLTSFPGADGLKTGYIKASGFNLATSAERQGIRLVGIVMGGKTAAKRDELMKNLLENAFTQIAQKRPLPMAFAVNPEMVLSNMQVAGAGTQFKEKEGVGDSDVVLPTVKVNQSTKTQYANRSSKDKAILQVGAFKDYNSAQQQATRVIRQLNAGKIKIEKTNKFYRALVINVPANKAEAHCHTLKQQGTDCLVVYR